MHGFFLIPTFLKNYYFLERQHFESLIFVPACLPWLELDQVEAQDLEISSKSFKLLNHHLLPPRAWTSRKLELEVELGVGPRHSAMGHRHLTVPNTHPDLSFNFIFLGSL